MHKRSGGHALVESLSAHGVKKVFCVPGESFLDALDALVDASGIHTITCRHESGASFMAEAYAKLTGHPGICFVTRGPGACNASIGVHAAMQDSTPLILLIGQVGTKEFGREAWQEIDYLKMFQHPTAKWVTQVEKTSDIPHAMQQAFDIATSGRPGPVVVALPEDVLSGETDAPELSPAQPAHFAPTHTDIERLKEILSAAKNPLVITGGGSWTDAGIAMFENFCERARLPVAAAFRRQDIFRNSHECYAGVLGLPTDPRLVKNMAEADVILAVGARLDEVTTQGYTAITPGVPKQKLIHIYPDAAELNRVYQATLAIHSSVVEFAKAVDDVNIDGNAWADRTARMNGEYADWTTPRSRDKFTVDLDGVFEDLINELPPDAILASDAGNFTGWLQRYARCDRPMRMLAPVSGAMGPGVPSAVAASLACPDRTVIGFVGDGGFLMTGQEMATAMLTGAHPILLVFNNNMYGSIRMHQERYYPGRVSATDLLNPDFVALAKSYGAEAMRVEKTEDFLPVFRRALSLKKLVLIEIKMDPQQITTQKTLAEIAKG